MKPLALRLQERCQRMTGARWTDLHGQELPQQAVVFETAPQFWEDSLELARDPARGSKVDPATLEEAAVAMHAQAAQILRGVKRESSGHSEFCDWEKRRWDVKSPLSPPADKPFWVFDVNHEAEVVHHEVDGDEHVLLNLTRCLPADAQALREQLVAELAPWEQSRVWVLQL